jgi:hypothetical protein
VSSTASLRWLAECLVCDVFSLADRANLLCFFAQNLG